ncbi:MAG: hypothetical protein CL566_07495 [Alphaproteobacteria bacterium]|mgnify:CR=1 FL=1|nr:hypothetical protein [Alphaproteobacteria bacterium]
MRPGYANDPDARENMAFRRGTRGDDHLTGSSGRDLLSGRDGDCAITEIEANSGSGDRRDIREFGFSYFSYLVSATNDAGTDTEINLCGDDSVTLRRIQKVNRHDDDFPF